MNNPGMRAIASPLERKPCLMYFYIKIFFNITFFHFKHKENFREISSVVIGIDCTHYRALSFLKRKTPEVCLTSGARHLWDTLSDYLDVRHKDGHGRLLGHNYLPTSTLTRSWSAGDDTGGNATGDVAGDAHPLVHSSARHTRFRPSTLTL